MGYYGSLDLTKLGQIVRLHPELVKTVTMRDGTQHKFLNIDVNEKQQADQYGNVAYIKASCKKAEQRQGLNYYLTNLKPSQSNAQPSPQPTPKPVTNDEGDIPF